MMASHGIEPRESPTLSLPARATVLVCIVCILFIGIYPNPLIKAAELAVQALK